MLWGATPVMGCVYAHFLLNTQVTGMSELFPLFATRAATRVEDEILVDNSGLGLHPSQVGQALISLGLTLFITPILYPKLERASGGHLGCFRVGMGMLTLVCLTMPSLRALRQVSTSAMWVGLVAIGVMRGLSGPFIFSAVSVVLNDLIVDRPGLYNGLAMSASSLARAIAPISMGSLFASVTATGAATATNNAAAISTVGYRLPFYLLAIVGLVNLCLVSRVVACAARGSAPRRVRRSKRLAMWWRRWRPHVT